MEHLVLLDPKGLYRDGALVDESVARQIAQHGACTIPVERGLFELSAVGGFFERRWGSGLSLAPAITSRLSPMLIWIKVGLYSVHWRARLLSAPEPGVERPTGFLRIIGDTTQPNTSSSFSADEAATKVDLSKLGEPDAAGGWNVGGAVRISPTMGGFLALALYGAGRGARLAFSAVSQTEK